MIFKSPSLTDAAQLDRYAKLEVQSEQLFQQKLSRYKSLTSLTSLERLFAIAMFANKNAIAVKESDRVILES